GCTPPRKHQVKWLKPLSPRGNLFSRLRGIAWRRRDVSDAVIIVVILTAQFVFFDVGDLFLKVANFAREYEDWGADDLVLMSFMLSICLIIYSFRRLQDLAK